MTKKLKSIFVYGLGNKLNDVSFLDYEKIGGKITELTKSKNQISVLIDKDVSNEEFLMRLGYGSILGSYSFNKYKTKNLRKSELSLIEVITNNSLKINRNFNRYKCIAEGYFLQI